MPARYWSITFSRKGIPNPGLWDQHVSILYLRIHRWQLKPQGSRSGLWKISTNNPCELSRANACHLRLFVVGHFYIEHAGHPCNPAPFCDTACDSSIDIQNVYRSCQSQVTATEA